MVAFRILSLWKTSGPSRRVGEHAVASMASRLRRSRAGGTEFCHQNLIVQPKKGLTLIWPADWTFTHRGVPSPTQEKIITTGWFNFT